ncbi:MAG: metal ABC transporter permease, partial [Phycisphaerales bacterium]
MNEPLFHVIGYGVRSYDLWVVATGVCCAVACGVLGCFLVLRRMSLLGDAISHAVLPGIAAGFLVWGRRGILPMLLGAGGAGVLTAGLSGVLSRYARVAEDAALGVVFTTLFALGVVMITFSASSVDLDPGCVLYGVIEMTPLDTVLVLGMEMPRAFAGLFICLLIAVVMVGVFFKELAIVSFDPGLA